MARTKLTNENRAWVVEHPQLAVAAANLRGQAGMSERAIYETLKREVGAKVAPSYRDLRAAFAAYEAGHGTIAGERGRRIAWKDLRVTEGASAYRKNRKSQFSPKQMDELNRKVVVGYLIHAETPASQFADPAAFARWEESQSYDVTPPF